MIDHEAEMYAALSRLAADPEEPDRVREAAVVILNHIDGVWPETLPDGPVDPLTGHPFR